MNKKDNSPGWKHAPSGRTVADEATYKRICKSWDKHFPKDPFEIEKLNEKKKQQEFSAKENKRKPLKEEIKKLEALQDEYILRRDNHIAVENQKIKQQIDDYTNEIKRLSQARSICIKAERSFRKEAMDKYPLFEKRNELKNLRAKLGRV